MNPVQPIFDAVLTWLPFMIPIIVAIGVLKILFGARIKGAVGERKVSSALRGMGAEVMNDVLIPDGRGGLTQLDHVVLTPNGLLVIETKNYQGMIFGWERDKQWTQKLGRKSYQFNNPLHQNYLHTEALKALLPGTKVQGWIVFAGAGKFPKGEPEGVSTYRSLKKDIMPLVQGNGIDIKLWDAWETLKSEARTDRSARQEHLASISGKHGGSMTTPVEAGLLMVFIFSIIAGGVFYFWDKEEEKAIKPLPSQASAPGPPPVYKTIASKPVKQHKPAPLDTDSNEWRCNYWREQYRTDKREQVMAAMEDNCSPVPLKWEKQ